MKLHVYFICVTKKIQPFSKEFKLPQHLQMNSQQTSRGLLRMDQVQDVLELSAEMYILKHISAQIVK